MFESITSFAEYDFMRRALLAGLFLAVTCGLLSPFVVLRRLSFSADGLAHASLGGLALGIFALNLGPNPTLPAYIISFLFTCVVAAAMAYISGQRRISSDTAVGVCYLAAFSLGVVLLSWKNRASGHLEHFFFGSILAVNPLEVWLLAGLALLTTLFVLRCWRWLGSWTFDEDLARVTRVPTFFLRYGLMLLVAATVVLSTRVVGVLIVTALLIIPGVIGMLWGRTMAKIVVLSLASAIASAITGLVASNSSGRIQPGPIIVLVGFLLFVASLILTRWQEHRQPVPVGPAPAPEPKAVPIALKR
jgi:zinc transport system permease protein